MHDFAWSTYRQLATQEENVFFSPYSIEVALTLTAEGARDETAAQMLATLGLESGTGDGAALARRHAQLAAIAQRLAPRDPPAATRERLQTLRQGLDASNLRLRQSGAIDAGYLETERRARAVADEINTLQRGIDPSEFRSANALWTDRSFAPEPDYVAALARHHGDGLLQTVDFRHDHEAGRAHINAWVAQQTRDRIRDLLGEGSVDADTRLVLTNAVYFLGEWLEPFDPARTRDEPFTPADADPLDAALMRGRKSEQVRYGAFDAAGRAFATPHQVEMDATEDGGRYPDRGFQLLELPYRGGRFSMLVLLPRPETPLTEIESSIDATRLNAWIAQMETRKVDVVLPRFRLEAGFDVSRALQAQGMRRAFVNPATGAGAQFEGMHRPQDPRLGLHIGAVVHRAFVQVDEKGTEAAAATAVVMAAGSARPLKIDFVPEVRADRPFVFVLREREAGTVLFIGRLSRPPVAG